MHLPKEIIVEPLRHRNENRLKLIFKYDKELIDSIKKIENSKWSASLRAWHIPANNDIHSLNNKFKGKIIFKIKKENSYKNTLIAKILIDKIEHKIILNLNNDIPIKEELAQIQKHYRLKNYPKWFFAETKQNYTYLIKLLQKNNYKFNIKYKKSIDEHSNPLIKNYVQIMLMRNNSKNTIQAYLPYFKAFVNYFKNKNQDITKLTAATINAYVKNKIIEEQLAENSQKHLISAIKYYYEHILQRDKLYFNLSNVNKKINTHINIQLPEILNIIKKISLPQEQLLVLFYYTFNLSFYEIAALKLKKSKLLLNKLFEEYPQQKKQIIKLVNEYYFTHKPKQYFFEKNELTNYTQKDIKLSIYSILGKYKMLSIYKKEYEHICLSANLKANSCKNYLSYFLTFLKYYNFIHPLNINEEQIKDFILNLNKNNYSKNTINQYINSIKLFYETGHKIIITGNKIFRPKRGKKLPVILNTEELSTFFNAIKNKKHKTLMLLTYSAGLRRNETLELRVKDIDFVRNEIRVNSGKGNKDRIRPILLEYIKEYKPEDYLFEGATGGKYSFSSFSRIFKNALKKSGIQKELTLHSLRHSFATHLIEQGTDVRYVQELLGHESIKTTVVYTHVARNKINKIKSPLDNINLKAKKDEQEDEKIPP